MYKPKFNSVLVEIDDKDAEWGGESNAEMLGKSYSKGKVVEDQTVGIHTTQTQPLDIESLRDIADDIDSLIGKEITWNEGAEAGTTFEEDGKLYGFIYWWDIRGIRE